MSDLVEPLSWDSDFFGFSIGRVALDGATEATFEAIDAEARALGITCLYGTLDPNVDPKVAQVAQIHGHRLVDVVITFERPAAPFHSRPTDVVVREGTLDDLDRLDAAIETLEPWSRYGSDPRFSREDSLRMLRAWVERAAREPDRMLGVAEDETGLIGVATHVRHPVPRVDLMGVTRPSGGVSWAFIKLLIDWADGGAVEAGPCAARNVAPIRFLEHCGFASMSSSYRFHRWFDE